MIEKLEPEKEGIPSYKERAEQTYDALRKILDRTQFGQETIYLSKTEVEGLLGLLSHRFEGVF